MATPPDRSPRELTRKGKAVRKAILDAGTDLFAMQGMAATTITEIASKAVVNRAMISYYFGSKGGLYDAIIDEAVEAVARSLEKVRGKSGDDDPMRELVTTLARVLEERPHFGRMVIQEYFAPGRLFEPETATKLSGFVKLTEATLLTSRLSRAAQKYDPQVVHLIIVGSLVYFMLTEPFRRQMQGKVARIITQPSTEEFARTLGEILSRGLSD